MNIQEMILATETDVFAAFTKRADQMNRQIWLSEDKDMFMFIEGNCPICLVAHVDTVSPLKSPVGRWIEESQGNLRCYRRTSKGKATQTILGADDRAGCYALYQLMEGKLQPHILLTNMEECGGAGAKAFAASDLTAMFKIMFFIEFDRKGCNSYVQYNDNPDELHKFMEQFNINFDKGGSFSDIAIISRVTKMPSINMACGYYHQHTEHEYLNLLELRLAIQKTRLMIADFPVKGLGEIKPYVIPVYSKYDYEGYGYGGYSEDYGYGGYAHDYGKLRVVEAPQTHKHPKPIIKDVLWTKNVEKEFGVAWCNVCADYMANCTCICYHCGEFKRECICKVKSASQGNLPFPVIQR